MPAFELSRSAALNELIRAARACSENSQDKTLARELAARLKFMAIFVDQLRAQYRSSKELRPSTSLIKELDPLIRQELERLKTALKRIDRWLDDRQADHLVRGCREAQEAADSMLGAFDRLRQEEESFPTYSESPLVNELASVALGVARGQIPDEPLRIRLDAFYSHWKQAMGDAREWVKSPAENEQVLALIPEITRGMEKMKRGLKEMSRYFSDKNREHLKKGCEMVLETASHLLGLRKKVLEAAAPRLVCPRCSESNAPGSKVCRQCQARLPELAMGPASTFEVEAGLPGQARFAYIVRLEEAVEAFLDDRLAAAELRPTVEWFAANVRQGRRALDNLKPPASFPSEELRQGAEASRKSMEASSRLFLEGVELLERFFVESHRSHLEQGVERIRAGAALMAEAQERMRLMGFGGPR
ncbi:hypothetical protein DYH09_09340 [bacterium CPR1]|nr:hypothetical protein [bacterium CPR1]